MVMSFLFEGLSPRYPLFLFKGDPNSATNYQRSFFQKFTFISILVLTKCSPLFLPLGTLELGSEQLCPNPVDFQETYSTSFYRFFPNNVKVLELVRPSKNVTSNIPCKFQFQQVRGGLTEVRLLGLQQRSTLITFQEKCSVVLEFPGRWGEGAGVTCETDESSHVEVVPVNSEKGIHAPGKFEIRITPNRIVKWTGNGRITFELPDQGSAPYITALFQMTTQTGGCQLLLQQYYSTSLNDSSSCHSILKRKLVYNVCGQFECSLASRLIDELKGNLVGNELPLFIEEPVPGEKIRTLGYFLKGLLLPLLISVSATLGYLIWRRRANEGRLIIIAGLEGVSLGTQTHHEEGSTLETMTMDDEGHLIQLDDDVVVKVYSQDKPPTYESLLEPPTYEQATQPLLMSLPLLEEEQDDDEPLLDTSNSNHVEVIPKSITDDLSSN